MFKKLKWYFFYKRTIRKNRDILLKKHGIKIDWVNRMYKTYTLTDNDLDDIKSYGPEYVDKLLETDRAKIEETLLELKVHQFVGLMEIEVLNQRQIGVAFRFKYFDTAKILNVIIWSFIGLFTLGLSYLIYPTLISLGIGLISFFFIYLITRLFVVKRVVS